MLPSQFVHNIQNVCLSHFICIPSLTIITMPQKHEIPNIYSQNLKQQAI